ncbi:hypothetical protein EYB53_012255 [Candidatus Chloroploca sp. M-50]|uniref:Uncharacterized protein n=1 Tax=Candidatus Chloroploca mongolica TaxID=2528176 RepID=A0ABS4DAJ4_9CHLR|nr:hypothetical protein [Candidatus Chloroploca mongolica]MBP1466478.1 hypothetical protein [Candidatus Chloroploca mongolica]
MGQIDQLWYTASPVGLGTTGYQVRAASPGLSDLNAPRFRLIEALIRYETPLDTTPTTLDPDQAPITLAFLENSKECVVIHRVFVGLTWDRRPGNFFTHLLAGIPTDIHPLDIIQHWGSSFWNCDDTGLERSQTNLPTVSKEDLLRQVLYSKLSLELIKPEQLIYVIRAFLSPGTSQRLFIAAPPDHVARLIWALLRCLPRCMTRRLRFSTYEQDVTKSATLTSPTLVTNRPLIVGTCYGQAAEDHRLRSPLLPSALFTAQNSQARAYDCYTEQGSPLNDHQRIANFAHFATACLLSNDQQQQEKLERLIKIIDDRVDPEDSDENHLQVLLTVYRFLMTEGTQPLTRDDLTDLFSQTWPAIDVIGEQVVQTTFLNLALNDATWWEQYGKKGLEAICRHAESQPNKKLKADLKKLADACVRVFHEALQQHHTKHFDIAYAILRQCDQHRVQKELIAILETYASPNDSSRYPFELRIKLLSTWSSYKLSGDQEGLYQRWLILTWDQLVDFLKCNQLTSARKKQAIELKILGDESLSSQTFYKLSRSEEWRRLLPDVIQHIADGSNAKRLVDFYVDLPRIENNKQDNNDFFNHLLLCSKHFAPEDIDRLLKARKMNDTDVIKLIISNKSLQRDFDQRPYTTTLLQRSIADISLKNIDEKIPLLDIVSNVQTSIPLKATAQQAKAWLSIKAFRDKPNTHSQTLQALEEALRSMPSEITKELTQWLLTVLAPLPENSDELLEIMKVLGPSFDSIQRSPQHSFATSDSEWVLFFRLFEYVLEHHQRKPDLIALYAEVLFRQPFPSKLSSSATRTNKNQEKVLKLLVKSNRSVYKAIDKYSRQWDSPNKEHWHSFAEKHYSKSLFERIFKDKTNLLILILSIVLILLLSFVSIRLIEHLYPTSMHRIGQSSISTIIKMAQELFGNETIQPLSSTETVDNEMVSTGSQESLPSIYAADQLILPSTTPIISPASQNEAVSTKTTTKLPFYYAPNFDQQAGIFESETTLLLLARYSGSDNWLQIREPRSGEEFWVEASQLNISSRVIQSLPSR